MATVLYKAMRHLETGSASAHKNLCGREKNSIGRWGAHSRTSINGHVSIGRNFVMSHLNYMHVPEKWNTVRTWLPAVIFHRSFPNIS